MSLRSRVADLENKLERLNSRESETNKLASRVSGDLNTLLDHMGVKVVKTHIPENWKNEVVKSCRKCGCELGTSGAFSSTAYLNFPYGYPTTCQCPCDCHKKKEKKNG